MKKEPIKNIIDRKNVKPNTANDDEEVLKNNADTVQNIAGKTEADESKNKNNNTETETIGIP